MACAGQLGALSIHYYYYSKCIVSRMGQWMWFIVSTDEPFQVVAGQKAYSLLVTSLVFSLDLFRGFLSRG